ncbi:hypothetical protein [Streptococcus danieliae]|uniref:hypothetical protein n=1 Tax=Streptococcus danieliae TaxID=747656 RepID=UPI0026ECAD87|nr:hypothetical protein [Streptococcus danieliae]
MKKTLLVSSLLLAPALIYTQEVQAQEFQQDSNIPLIDHAAALKEAQNQGILIVQDQTQTLSTIKAVDQAYIQQTQELQAATNQYVLEKEKYTSDLTNYEAALKEIEKYQQAEENRQKEQEAAQNQYQQELAAYEKEQAQYQQNLETYQQQEQANSQSKANYQKELEQFEKT